VAHQKATLAGAWAGCLAIASLSPTPTGRVAGSKQPKTQFGIFTTRHEEGLLEAALFDQAFPPKKTVGSNQVHGSSIMITRAANA
jgi:hypothetical protein